MLSGFLVGVGAALVGPVLGGAHGWLGHLPHDLLIALPGAALLAMMVGVDDIRDVGWSALGALAGVGVVTGVLLVAGVH